MKKKKKGKGEEREKIFLPFFEKKRKKKICNDNKISVIKDFIASIVMKNTLVAGIVSCQFISNVPTAIFLSKFTENYRDLLVSVNIGSLGIIISSLASLITLKEFLKHQPQNFKRYMGLFTLINTAFLAVMIVITVLT